MAICEICGGVGLVPTERGSKPCSCQPQAQAEARLKRAGIPPGFATATLANFECRPHNRFALTWARRFVDEFVLGQHTCGALLTGTVGTGKTHLAAGVVRRLVETKGIEARFVDVRELLDRLRASYDDSAAQTQAQIMAPIFAADLLVIDELGAARPTDWVFETIELLIGGAYNRMTPVIVTTNLPNLAAGGDARNGYERAARPETLGDRIGSRMFSRLQQMCTPLDMTGPDWRVNKR